MNYRQTDGDTRGWRIHLRIALWRK